MTQKIEILAPAGDEEMLRAAVFSGADCVYLGVEGFNARRGAANFGGEALAQAVAFCHARACRVYAALNTLVHPAQLPAAAEAVRQVALAGCDAIIVQDIGMAQLVRAAAPQLPLHASTQMSVHSLEGVRALEQLGFARVILARELRLDEIEYIAARSPLELEVFVHGALCVSVSGQCLMSAFLGGRSANRGGCAGPCRLPFAAACGAAPPHKGKPESQRHDLSLKDLSILDALPQLAQAGVISAKIEGRLRGPEYCAAVVDAARRARESQPYDAEWLAQVFGRSGFTKGWFAGQGGAQMFGRRTQEDSAASKTALPLARQIYRREMPRVPVDFELSLKPDGAALTISCEQHSLQHKFASLPSAAREDSGKALAAALQKTGGTPFFARQIQLNTNNLYLPVAEVSAARRALLSQLLALRQAAPTGAETRFDAAAADILLAKALPTKAQPPAKQHTPALRAHFAAVAQMPPEAEQLCAQLSFPLWEAEAVPQALRAKSWLRLPRALFGNDEQRAAKAVAEAGDMGFLGFEIGNVAHLEICRGAALHAGFGLNASNPLAVQALAQQGCRAVTLSPELTLRQIADIAAACPDVELDALAYGHLPLMLTRACPLQSPGACAKCPRLGHLTDRRGAHFALICKDGTRTIHNPLPLWMADRLPQLQTHSATLYFCAETKEQAAETLRAFAAGSAAPGGFTRGLYDKGTDDHK